MSADPVQLLRDVYPKLDNGQKETVKQAVDLITEMKAELTDLQSAISRQPQPEAPASATVKVVDPLTQMEWLVTVREPAFARQLIKELGAMSAALAEVGLIGFDAYVDQRRSERGQASEQPVSQPANRPAISQSVGDGLTFKAETLEVSTKGENTYYKVKGPKFPQYGVTVWPEVLQNAGFDLDTIGRVTPLKGYIAHYVLKEDGKPNKVIGLSAA